MLEQSYLTRPLVSPDDRFFGETPKHEGLPQETVFKKGAFALQLCERRSGKSMLAEAMSSHIRDKLREQEFARKILPVEVTGVDVSGSMTRELLELPSGTRSGRVSSGSLNLQNVLKVDVPASYQSKLYHLDAPLKAQRLIMNKADYDDILTWSQKAARQNAKLINFGLAYGASPKQVADAIYHGGKTATRFLEDAYFHGPKYVLKAPAITKEDRKAYQHGGDDDA